jgi:AraC-like DNA-binding protein
LYLQENPGAFRLQLHGIDIGSLGVNKVTFGSGVRILVTTPQDFYALHFMIKGRAAIDLRGDTIPLSRSRGCLLWAVPGTEIEIREGSVIGGIRIPRTMLEEHLRTLLGDDPAEPLLIASAIDGRRGRGSEVLRLFRRMIEDLEEEVGWDPRVCRHMVEALLSELLIAQPSNYSDRLTASPAVTPDTVLRVEEFIEGHLGEAITLASLAEVAGISGSALEKAFRRHRGESPMKMLRRIRLERARESLRSAPSDATVTRIATAFGFTHLGRFSVEYRKRFGESPSDTLRSAQR